MSNQELFDLLERYARNATTEEEEDRLVELFAQPQYKEIILNYLEKHWDAQTGERLFKVFLTREKAEGLFESILTEIDQSGVSRQTNRRWYKWVAAACVAAVLAISGYFFLDTNSAPVPMEQLAAVANDVDAPTSLLAVLKTDAAEEITLDLPETSGLLQNGVLVKKEDGSTSLEYAEPIAGAVPTWNELKNPAGSQKITLRLADGTRVVLNAGSSLRYPSYFSGEARTVELKGEAYFDVARYKKMSFQVNTEKAQIEVLGTQFNVNTHGVEEDMEVTLLEGSVKVIKGKELNILVPGQKAVIDADIKIDPNADLDQAIAWTNDLFNFKGMALADILRQMEQWYGVEVDMSETLPDIKLSGIISRTLPASKVLEMLSLSSGLQFSISGKKIKVVSL